MSWLRRLRNTHLFNGKRANQAMKKNYRVTALLFDLLEDREKSLEEYLSRIAELEQTNKELGQNSLHMNQLQTEVVRLDKLRTEMEENAQALHNDNVRLSYEVRERESQIFSLQPYHQELTVHEAKNEYINLVSNVKDFVDHWTSSILQSDELQTKSLLWAGRHRISIKSFKSYLAKWKDLYNTLIDFSSLDMDQEILVSYILRFLQDFLFVPHLTHSNLDSAVEFIDSSMRNNANPKLDEYAVRSWRSQTNLAIVMSPVVVQQRQQYGHKLSIVLAEALNFVIQGKDREAFIKSISTEVIDQALKLQQRFVTSTNTFIMGTHTRVHPGQKFEGDITQLEDLDCTNVAANMRKFNIDKLNSAKELHQELFIVFSLCPALLVSQASRGRSLEELTIVSKEEILVAWKEEYDAFLQDPEHFRSQIQKQREIYRIQELNRKRSRAAYEEAEARFTQSLLREAEAAEARRRADQIRIERERREAEERAQREEEERKLQDDLRRQARLRDEEAATNVTIKRVTRRCPNCTIQIEKNGGCDHMQCSHCRHQFNWSEAR
ncbi:hypothetical protein F4806DRAFT_506250 [Annulohypoxylon nitens]|nr:hypothetical protein F4806DRAFT_506250 [Annulohypoxylon nitens]